MKSPLQRLYQTKLALLATITTVAGVGLLLLVHLLDDAPGWVWLRLLPVGDIGSTLFATGLIVIAFEYINREDAEERATERLRQVLVEEAPAIRDAVINGFAFNADDLARVSSTETLDQIIRNSLAIRLGDRDMADGVYRDLESQLAQATESWRDVSITVTLTPWTGQVRDNHHPLFLASVRYEYRLSTPTQPTWRFAAVSDQAEYRELSNDPTVTKAWSVGKSVDAATTEAFELIEFSLDGKPQPIRRSQRKHGQSYSVTTDPNQQIAGGAVHVAYTYRGLVERDDHLFRLGVSRPCNGLSIDFRHGGCDISHVNVLDYLAGGGRTRVSRSPEGVPEPSIQVYVDGWVFPGAGVAFVWAMERRKHTASATTDDRRRP